MLGAKKIRERLFEIFPYESHYADVDGHRLHYLDEGKGPVVVCLHGNPTWCFYYRALVRVLSGSYRVIVPDYIGCGLSDHPTDKHYRARDRVGQITELLNQLGIKDFSLVMHDWGGPIGTYLALQNLERVKSLVYLNTTLTEIQALPNIIKVSAHPLLGKVITQYSKQFLRFTTELGVAKKLSKQVKEGYFLPYADSAARTAIWDFVCDIPFQCSHPSYDDVLYIAKNLPKFSSTPVKIIWGLQDPCFHREMLRKVAAHFPHAQVQEIPDASHLVLEDATPEVTSSIKEFLDRNILESSELSQTSKAKSDCVDMAAQSPNILYKNFETFAGANKNSVAVVTPTFQNSGNVRYEQISFGDLLTLAGQYARGLASMGLCRGDRVVFLVTPGVDFLALVYAVMALGATPVLIDGGMELDMMVECINKVKPHVFIGTPKAQVLRLLNRRLSKSIKFHIVAGDSWLYGKKSLYHLKKFASSSFEVGDCPAQALIAFTSGATGSPKGVVFTNAMLESQSRIFKEVFKLKANSLDLPLLPIFSIFSLGLGVGSVFPSMNAAKPLSLKPEEMVRLMSDLAISSSFGSPTLWKKISDYCVLTGKRLDRLESVFMAGAPIPKSTLEAVQNLLPNGVAFTPYGATEALPVTLVSAKDIPAKESQAANTGEVGTYVGSTVLGVSLMVIKLLPQGLSADSAVEELAPFDIGEIAVSGDNISKGYFENERADLASKFTYKGKTWHLMGDVGYVDSDGGLYFCGRKVHMVRTANKMFFSVPIERVFNEHPWVNRSALVDLGGEAGLVVEPKPEHIPNTHLAQQEFIRQLRDLGAKSEVTRPIQTFLFNTDFPVDRRHNAKIFRDRLSAWARKELENSEVKSKVV